mmetsp:Transcript_36662/g.56837  ORF Transcript_36662/g.56837 Transcript_36662/m.56837 type:complete len:367 (+) Transcript_36662:56-1156(+)
MALNLLRAAWRLSPSTSQVSSCASRRRWVVPHKVAYQLTGTTSFSTGSGDAPTVTAALVKELRTRTGASMGKCRQALVEEACDIEKAVDWLRKRGIRSMERRTNDATESLLAVHLNGTSSGTIVEIQCETDFVAQNALLQHLALAIASTAGAAPSDLATATLEVSNADLSAKLSTGASIEKALLEIGSVLGERLVLGQSQHLEIKPDTGVVAGYVHKQAGAVSGTGRMAALVSLIPSAMENGTAPKLTAIASQLARHIVASRPRFVKVEDVPAEVLEKERNTLKEAYLEELDEKRKKNLTDVVLTKVLDGKTKKFYQEAVLMQQELIVAGVEGESAPVSVEKWLKDEAKSLGIDSLTVQEFRLVCL